MGEAALVGVAGLLVALGANLLSPRGLELSRDYFPELSDTLRTGPAEAAETTVDGVGVVADGSPPSGLEGESVSPMGLQSIAHDRAVELWKSPAFLEERVVFVDARSEEAYREGHIPGAFVLDRFYPEQHLPGVLAAAMVAEQVVVYCNGGECEDSEYAAVMLKDAGVPDDRLWVYRGGIEEWVSSGETVERGERLSGDVQ